MRRSRKIVIAIIWAASLVGVGLYAQGRGDNTFHIQTPGGGEVVSTVLMGDKIGFAPAGPVDRSGRVPGYWVVKTNEGWVRTTAPDVR